MCLQMMEHLWIRWSRTPVTTTAPGLRQTLFAHNAPANKFCKHPCTEQQAVIERETWPTLVHSFTWLSQSLRNPFFGQRPDQQTPMTRRLDR